MKCAILLGCVLLTAASVSAQTRDAGPGSETPAPVLARPIDVDCDQGQTIGAALARLAARAQDPLTRPVVRVSGACSESVVIEGFDRVTLQGRPGATLTATSAATDSAAIKVVSSRRVEIQDLSIDAAAAFGGVLIRRCQDCAVRRTAISRGSVSVYVEQPGFTAISELRATGAAFGGVWVLDNAAARLSGALIEAPGSGWLGIWAYNNASLTLVGATVRGFFGGLGADGGALVQSAGLQEFPGDRTIRLENNNYTGVWATGRSGMLLGSKDVPVVIANNGTMGVVAIDASVTLGWDIKISNHGFAGLYADQHAHIQIANTDLSGHGTSLWVSLMSLVNVVGPVTVSGSTTDIQCDASSLVSGATGISGTDPARIHCAHVQ